MHHGGVGLVFKFAAKIVVAEIFAQLIELALGGSRRLLQFAAAVGIDAFRAVQAPDLDRLIDNRRGCRGEEA